MNLEIVRKTIDKNSGNTFEELSQKKIKVAAYIRVSAIELEGSYESQYKYFYRKITNNTDWELVDIYGDKAISGTSTNKRSEFLRMICDALSRKNRFNTYKINFKIC